jgi:hypothetical protein
MTRDEILARWKAFRRGEFFCPFPTVSERRSYPRYILTAEEIDALAQPAGEPSEGLCRGLDAAIEIMGLEPDHISRELMSRAIRAYGHAEIGCCDGCGSTETIEEIRAKNPLALSCCPERKMLTASQWREKAIAANSAGFNAAKERAAEWVRVSMIGESEETADVLRQVADALRAMEDE